MKKVLITGEHSYIGTSFQSYMKKNGPDWVIDTVSVRGDDWKETDFGRYDCVLHMAGKAHADTGRASKETIRDYYRVNVQLTKEVAKKAKADGVKQFIYPGSIIIYGDSAPYGKQKVITAKTKPAPAGFYGDSKKKADLLVQRMHTDAFKTAVLRLPMVYGKGSRGNYPMLSGIAKKLPVFPNVQNARSMLYIENLCEFLKEVIEHEDSGVFYPQNADYTTTTQMVKAIAKASGKRVFVTRLLAPAVWLSGRLPGSIGALANKAFGNCTYEKSMSDYRGNRYQIYSLEESIRRTEGKKRPI